MTKLAKIEQNTQVSTVATPSVLLQMAMDQGADLDKLERLMELQQKWEDNEAKKAFTVAMASFRATCPEIVKDKKGHNSKYASLAHSLKVIKPHLSNHGLSHSWKTKQDPNGLITVTCFVTHELGYQEETSMSANADTSGSKNSIQAMGSTVSYLERYTLYALLGLASTDQDDDGQTAQPLITENDVLNLIALMEEVKANKAQFLKYMKVENLESIPLNQLARATNALESKRAK